MKKDEPYAEDLLTVAADVLRREIVPGLTGEDRLTVLMAINAIDTARREAAHAVNLSLQESEAVKAFAGDRDAVFLAESIRSGHFDTGPHAQELHTALLENAALRCRVSNPRYLDAAEKDWIAREDPS